MEPTHLPAANQRASVPDRKRGPFRDGLRRVGDFYSHRPGEAAPLHVASLLVVGCGVLLIVELFLPYFTPPVSLAVLFDHLPLAACVFGVGAVFRRERGVIGAVAAVVGLGAALMLVLGYVFGYTYSWLMGILID